MMFGLLFLLMYIVNIVRPILYCRFCFRCKMALSSGWHPGGPSLILHRIGAKRKELDIEVNSVLEELQMIEDCSLSISGEMKTLVDNSRCEMANFEDCSRSLSDLDDCVTLTCDMMSRAIIELGGKPPEIGKSATEHSPQSLTDILTERLERKENELSINLELLQLSLRELKDLLKKIPESEDDGGGARLEHRNRSLAQLESLLRQVSCRVEEKETQLMRVWQCLKPWKEVLKGGEQEKSESHSSGYHAWSTSLLGEPAPASHLIPDVSLSILSGEGHCDRSDTPHKLQGEPGKTVVENEKEKVKENVSNTSLTPQEPLPVPTPCPVDQGEPAQCSQVSHTRPLLLHSSPGGSYTSRFESEIGKLSTAPEEDMLQMHEIQRKKLMMNLHKSFGVLGETLEVGQDYPGHKVVFEEGDPVGFWINFDTSARRKLNQRIQEYLLGAEPAPAEEVREGGPVLARY